MANGSDILLIIVAILFPPGHIHAFWLIYRKMKAEEQYGYGGYQYLGNGEFVANGGLPPVAPNYGSTGR
ncbi:hypothetical protein FRB98_004523 [Tulasnella sp. 332]|nr:hypothetical protein FRB98_004523 [Tulasnella sp. 332]